MEGKTHKTAVVITPSENRWFPIQDSHNLIKNSILQRQELVRLYANMPTTRCRRQISDQLLHKIAEQIDALSRQLEKSDHALRYNYFLDLSFLVASWLFGYPEAVKLKFAFVKDFLSTGQRSKLRELMAEISKPIMEIF